METWAHPSYPYFLSLSHTGCIIPLYFSLTSLKIKALSGKCSTRIDSHPSSWGTYFSISLTLPYVSQTTEANVLLCSSVNTIPAFLATLSSCILHASVRPSAPRRQLPTSFRIEKTRASRQVERKGRRKGGLTLRCLTAGGGEAACLARRRCHARCTVGLEVDNFNLYLHLI